MGTAEEQLLDEIWRLREEKRTLLKVLSHLSEMIDKLISFKVDGENWKELIKKCL
jgi:hypothetical protein